MWPLRLSNRCKLFEQIAQATWHKVIRNHRVGVNVNEPGRTNDIVEEIRTTNLNTNIGVWANNAWNEAIHGSDIDVFVETTPGQFIWWALQAKVLKLNGTYDVAPKQNDRPQWDKLEDLARAAGCIPRYLLYNGVSAYHHMGNDACGRAFTAEQFGCSLVEPMVVAQVYAQRTPRFRDFHPILAQPWRIITCCVARISQLNLTTYSAEQIADSIRPYRAVAGNTAKPLPLSSDFGESVFEDLNDLPIDAIDNLSRENGRFPMYRMVTRTTESLLQERR